MLIFPCKFTCIMWGNLLVNNLGLVLGRAADELWSIPKAANKTSEKQMYLKWHFLSFVTVISSYFSKFGAETIGSRKIFFTLTFCYDLTYFFLLSLSLPLSVLISGLSFGKLENCLFYLIVNFTVLLFWKAFLKLKKQGRNVFNEYRMQSKT